METRTFRERYEDSSNIRKAWVLKMLRLELNVGERQALRYINGEATPNKLTADLMGRVFDFSERTLRYQDLQATERLPVSGEVIE